MGKLFGKVMASLLSGAMLFGGTSFADGGLSKLCLVEDEDMRDGENVKECAICSNSVECKSVGCEEDSRTFEIIKQVGMENGEKIVKITKYIVGNKEVNKVIEGKDEEVCNVKMGCCGNYFCRRCILKWISSGEDNSYKCPLCRSKLDVDSAKSLLTSYERLQFEMRSKYNKLISYCKKNPDVALNAAFLGVYFPLVLGAIIYSSRNQKKSKYDCDFESDRGEKISGVDCGFDGCHVDDVCVAE